VKNLEYVNNTCLNMLDLVVNPQAAGLWVDASGAQHVENLIVTGNRFLNEADNPGYDYDGRRLMLNALSPISFQRRRASEAL
jgi:hypothetical protein